MGTAISLLALTIVGRMNSGHLLLALGPFPALLMGLWSARFAAGLLAGRWLRPAILLFAAASGLTAVLLGIVR